MPKLSEINRNFLYRFLFLLFPNVPPSIEVSIQYKIKFGDIK